MRKIEVPDGAAPVVAIVGGAVAGSEAAALCAKHGALVVVFEKGEKPYGKIEDGLPRWHEKLREKEYARIDENLSQRGVHFLPRTKIGRELSFEVLRELGFSAVVLANGAWRDRALPIEGIDRFVDRGLVYQNAFVHWFNHAHEVGYAGKVHTPQSGAIVLGGGLASIDVAKIINLELYARALRARGVEVSVVEMELLGIPETLAKHGLAPDALDVVPATLCYRRRKEDMPLASAAGDAPAQLAKAEAARVKIMERVERKYLVRFTGLVSPVGYVEEDDHLVGLRFVRNALEDGRLIPVPGSEHVLPTQLVVSSIGSIPVPIPGIPMKGELYDYEDPSAGRLRGLRGVFGLGNVLTGKGNIRDSRENAEEITEQVVSVYLGIADHPLPEPELARNVRQDSERVARAALGEPPASKETLERIAAWIEARWAELDYPGDYRAYISEQR